MKTSRSFFVLLLSLFMLFGCSETSRSLPCIGSGCGAGLKADAPFFNIADGSNVSPGTQLMIATTTAGATIRYTMNGDTPTESSFEYTGPISINSDVTIKAIAFKDTMEPSEVSSANYTISIANQVAAPVFNPAGTTVLKNATVNLYTTTPNATIRYTTGSTPPSTTSGNIYTQPIVITTATTIKAIAYMADGSQPASNVVTSSYSIQLAANPVIVANGNHPSSGSTICTSNTISMTSPTVGAYIKYNLTTNGTMPALPTATSGTMYSTPINLSVYNGNTIKIRARAFKADMDPSGAPYAYYDVISNGALPKPVITCSGAFNASSKTVTIAFPQQDCTSTTGVIIVSRHYTEGGVPPFNTSSNPSTWNPYSSFTITANTVIDAAGKKVIGFGSTYGTPVSKTCCVGTSCVEEMEVEAEIL